MSHKGWSIDKFNFNEVVEPASVADFEFPIRLARVKFLGGAKYEQSVMNNAEEFKDIVTFPANLYVKGPEDMLFLFVKTFSISGLGAVHQEICSKLFSPWIHGHMVNKADSLQAVTWWRRIILSISEYR